MDYNQERMQYNHPYMNNNTLDVLDYHRQVNEQREIIEKEKYYKQQKKQQQLTNNNYLFYNNQQQQQQQYDNKQLLLSSSFVSSSITSINISKDVLTKTSLLERRFRMILFLSYTIFVWIILIGKIVSGGFGEYLKHLTNWSWTLHAIYFLFDSLSYFDSTDSIIYFLTSHVLWTVNGITWLVFWLVFFVLGDNPDLLLKMSTLEGGEYDLGAILIGDRVFHVVPSIIILAYFFLKRIEIGMAVADIMNPMKHSFLVRMISNALILIVFPLIIILSYNIILDMDDVYGVHTPLVIILMTGLIIIAIHNVIPFTLYYKQYKQK